MIANVYYSPGQYGLEPVGEISWGGLDTYDFDLTAIWKDRNGQLYWASDSGCSCPTPFDRFTKVADLETGSAQDLKIKLAQWQVDRPYSVGQVAEIVGKLDSLGY